MYGKKLIFNWIVLAAAVALVALTPFHVSAANKLIVNGTDGQTPQFVVTDMGSIGVGTNNPLAAMHIKSAGAFPNNAIKVEGSPSNKGGGILCYNNNGSSAPTNGDRFGFIYFGSSYDGTANHPAGFAANTDADWTPSSKPAYFYFSTTAIGSTTRIERARITSSGNVGINTTTPHATLDVNGSFRINPGNTLPANAVAVSKPDCTDNNRGAFWFTQGSGTSKDSLQVCASDGSGVAWRQIY
jgi:hypothetical protein